jgi:RNA polymerase sigma-70 factor, ECF subfamily
VDAEPSDDRAHPFTPPDRDLLKRCLNRAAGSWNDFVDRYLSLIYHVIGYTAHVRSVRLSPEETEDVAAEILLKLVSKDFKVLREFRGESSLATYLTVVARRTCVAELAKRLKTKVLTPREGGTAERRALEDSATHKWIESQEEVEKLMRRLSGRDREIVRLHWLEGRSYEEISAELDMPVNSIGSILSRAREKLRESVRASGEHPAQPKATIKNPAVNGNPSEKKAKKKPK